MILGTPKMTKWHDDTADDTMSNTFHVILDGTELVRVKTTKFLGLTIDENLTWKYHIDNITKTISCNIGVMNKLKQFIPGRILYSLYCSLVLPYINYGILVWGSTCKTYIEKILKLQKWALRVISNSHYRSHTSPIFVKYNILNVYDMFKLETGVFMYKYSNGSLPAGFKKFFMTRSQIHDYQTRYKDNYNQTKNARLFSDRSIRTYGPILWNSLDDVTKNSNSIKHFKNQYKKYLISIYE